MSREENIERCLRDAEDTLLTVILEGKSIVVGRVFYGAAGALPRPPELGSPVHVSFSLRKFPIKVRTPDLGLVGDKYSRLKPDLQDVTTASKEERKTSFSGSMFWKAVLSAAHATALSVFFSCRCTLPVGAPDTPPTGRALTVLVFRYIPGSSTDLSAENSNKVRTATLATARDTSGILKNCTSPPPPVNIVQSPTTRRLDTRLLNSEVGLCT
ncbi:hypothetical protein Bbelb_374520 [Branchiostoma belcheri]|nr:hypothetical protein Bbelb_374520 [Branchiostoma belcheri]